MNLLDKIRADLRASLDERAAKQAELDAIVADVEARDDANMTEDETARFGEIRAALVAIDDQVAGLEARASELADAEARKAAAATAAAALPALTVTPDAPVVVRSEERTYGPGADRRGVSFLSDVASAFVGGDYNARARLDRHMAEERVERPQVEARAAGDAVTSAFAGIVVPQYLTDMVAPDPKAGRPFAELCTRHPMPMSGMTVNISRITTPTSAALQSSELAAASATSIDDTLLSISVQTIASQQTISRQALERGTGVESVVIADMLGEYNTTLDNTLINQATTGLDAVTDANVDIAYTDASATAAELWPKLFDAIQQIQTAVFKGADAFLMHPRRFWWLASSVGTNFPFVNLVGAGPQAGGSVAGTGYGSGPSGFLAGLPVYLDANIVTNAGTGTNQDHIYALTRSECHLWEDDVVFLRAEQAAAATLGVVFVISGYMAYTFSRYPSANARINGTGLITPTF